MKALSSPRRMKTIRSGYLRGNFKAFAGLRCDTRPAVPWPLERLQEDAERRSRMARPAPTWSSGGPMGMRLSPLALLEKLAVLVPCGLGAA